MMKQLSANLNLKLKKSASVFECDPTEEMEDDDYEKQLHASDKTNNQTILLRLQESEDRAPKMSVDTQEFVEE